MADTIMSRFTRGMRTKLDVYIKRLLASTKFRAKSPSHLGVMENFPYGWKARFYPPVLPEIKNRKIKIHLKG